MSRGKKGCFGIFFAIIGILFGIFLLSAFIAAMLSPNDSNQTTKEYSTTKVIEKSIDTTKGIDSVTTKAKTTEAVTTTPDEIIPYNKVSKYTVQNSRGHNTQNGYIIIGKGETARIAIDALPENLELKDFNIEYDKSMLNIKVESQGNNEKGTQSSFVFTVNAIKPGSSHIKIYSMYSSIKNPSNYTINDILVTSLTDAECRVVYKTEYGKKYHYSSSCPGSKVFSTILYDAIRDGYGPCKKCVH